MSEQKKDRYFARNDSKGRTYGWIPDFWVLGDSQDHNKTLTHDNRETVQFLCDALNENEKNKERIAELGSDNKRLLEDISEEYNKSEDALVAKETAEEKLLELEADKAELDSFLWLFIDENKDPEALRRLRDMAAYLHRKHQQPSKEQRS